MPDDPLSWKLLRFPEAIDAWVERESPKDDLRLVVLDWVMGRHDDPYRGMRREADFGKPVVRSDSGDASRWRGGDLLVLGV